MFFYSNDSTIKYNFTYHIKPKNKSNIILLSYPLYILCYNKVKQLTKFLFASILKMILSKKVKCNNVHIHICAWLVHVLIIDTLDKMLI
jgi:hypothetical protein